MVDDNQSNRRVALVTGASYGLGAEIAKTLARDGFDVAVTELNADDLADTVAAIEAEGARAAAIALDLRSMASLENAVVETIERLGQVDVLVNNAGRLLVKPALEVEPDEFSDVMAINVNGSYFMAQHVARHLVETERSGCIINLASTFTMMGAANVSPYGISKAAVGGITRHLAVEWAQYGIRVNAVAPGSVETKIRAALLAADPVRRETNMAKVPMKRFGTPEDMAGAVSYLASPAAAYVNGHVLTVDGGLTIS
ncbi:MAG: glucose 1-dehydrogenase [Alphaproteobacteria bacterium]|nr:glucose 1-dehydrogenase [Alphaproteobacteria bacterium]